MNFELWTHFVAKLSLLCHIGSIHWILEFFRWGYNGRSQNSKVGGPKRSNWTVCRHQSVANIYLKYSIILSVFHSLMAGVLFTKMKFKAYKPYNLTYP